MRFCPRRRHESATTTCAKTFTVYALQILIFNCSNGLCAGEWRFPQTSDPFKEVLTSHPPHRGGAPSPPPPIFAPLSHPTSYTVLIPGLCLRCVSNTPALLSCGNILPKRQVCTTLETKFKVLYTSVLNCYNLLLH